MGMGPGGFAAWDSSGGTMGTSLPALGAQVWHRVGVAELWCCPVRCRRLHPREMELWCLPCK